MDDLKFGIIQGRLTQSPPGCLQWFPNESWEDEFESASQIGINFIELIADISYNSRNPIWNDKGIDLIKKNSSKNNISIHTLCNDYIIDHSILDSKVIEQNNKLLIQAKKLCIKKYILPFFNKSEINPGNAKNYLNCLREIADIANDSQIEVLLETILDGKQLSELLEDIGHSNIKVVFDTGNRIAFGHNLSDDIEILGDKITHIHIKDKNINNENVILGTGLVNFSDVFRSLEKIKYNKSYVFETTRGSNPLKTAIYNMQVVNFFIENSKKNV